MSDFITTNVPLAPSAQTTQTVLPDWYTNYARQILSNQQALAGQGYQAYGGPRVAQFNNDQQQGFAAAREGAGAGAGTLQGAVGTVQGALAGPSATGAAQGYLTAAGQSTADTVQDFMNPYTEQVADRLGVLGARTLREQLLPAIGDQFVASGNYGGSRQAEAIGRSVRDTEESILAKQAELLQQGYGQSLSAAQNEASRMGALASTAGNLASTDANTRLAGAGALQSMAGQQQQMALTGAGALTAVGNQQQAAGQKSLDLAYEDFLRQQGYRQDQIDSMVKTFGGVATGVPKATMQEGYGPVGSPQPGTSTTQNIASILGALGSVFS